MAGVLVGDELRLVQRLQQDGLPAPVAEAEDAVGLLYRLPPLDEGVIRDLLMSLEARGPFYGNAPNRFRASLALCQFGSSDNA